MDVNTTSKHPTYFLRGVELVRQANKDYHLGSENWPYPTQWTFGFPSDYYYAEIWHDGMDWNSNYWLIETAKLENPKIYPAIHFEDSNDRSRYNDYDFEQLLMAIMSYRRDILWLNKRDHGVADDMVWPYIRKVNPIENLERCPCMVLHRVLHASQERVEFFMNVDLVPSLGSLDSNGDTDYVKTKSEFPIEEKYNV